MAEARRAAQWPNKAASSFRATHSLREATFRATESLTRERRSFAKCYKNGASSTSGLTVSMRRSFCILAFSSSSFTICRLTCARSRVQAANAGKDACSAAVGHLFPLLLQIFDALDELVVVVLQAGALLCHAKRSGGLRGHWMQFVRWSRGGGVLREREGRRGKAVEAGAMKRCV